MTTHLSKTPSPIARGVRELMDSKLDAMTACAILAVMSGDQDRIDEMREMMSVGLAVLTTQIVPPWETVLAEIEQTLGDTKIAASAIEAMQPMRAVTEQIHAIIARACPDELAEGMKLMNDAAPLADGP